MHRSLLAILACPECHASLVLKDAHPIDPIQSGSLQCAFCNRVYQIINGIPRFASTEADYVGNFGWQWEKFRRTQVDQLNGTRESENRFRVETGWNPEGVKDALVLDVGCGSGRFSAIAAKWGARVVAIDLAPGAVEACSRTMTEIGAEIDVVQASLYKLPFRPQAFDRIYSLGVLQHTPDPKEAMEALPPFLKPGGSLAYWIYEKRWYRFLMIRNYIRVVTQRLPRKANWAISLLLVCFFFPVALPMSFIPILKKLQPLLPISPRIWWGRLTLKQSWHWTTLDTFDSYSAKYEISQREKDVRKSLTRAGMTDIQRTPARGMAITARRPLPGR
ncbi:MAG: methyltransferase domain-containing protein [Chloroflexi bacterium]|nr:methyltransferase domain-containing protein [Chloroflexota bacterium]